MFANYIKYFYNISVTSTETEYGQFYYNRVMNH